MPSRTGRVLLIGLDSADAELIERWSDAGHLPVLAALRADGSWSRIGTTATALHVSAWPTLHTATRPGVHGIYHAYQIRAGEQDVHRTAASEIALAPFWKHLDDAGARCIVVDAFMNAPVAGFGGIEILEYGTWTWFDQPRSTPEGLWKEIRARFGAYPAPEHTKVHGRPEPHRFRDALVAGAAVKGALGRWLMREQPWDFLFFNFAEPHPAGHYLWHLQDSDYPLHPGEPRGPGPAARGAAGARRVPRRRCGHRRAPPRARRRRHGDRDLRRRHGAELLRLPPDPRGVASPGPLPRGRRGPRAARGPAAEARVWPRRCAASCRRGCAAPCRAACRAACSTASA